MSKSIPPSKADQWLKPLAKTDKAKYADYVMAREQLMVNIANVMAAHKLDAIVLKTVEHQPNLIKESMYPPYKPTRGLINLNTFLVFTSVITVPAGFTTDNIPVGMTFFGLAYSEPTLFKLAYAYEQATHHRKPPPSAPALKDH